MYPTFYGYIYFEFKPNVYRILNYLLFNRRIFRNYVGIQSRVITLNLKKNKELCNKQKTTQTVTLIFLP